MLVAGIGFLLCSPGPQELCFGLVVGFFARGVPSRRVVRREFYPFLPKDQRRWLS